MERSVISGALSHVRAIAVQEYKMHFMALAEAYSVISPLSTPDST